MTKQSDVFSLIRSMSQGEKRHFTQFAGRTGRPSKQYLVLFTAMDRMKEYDEAKLKMKAGGRAPFAVQKAQLYTLLLKSLRIYHEDRNAATHLRNRLTEIYVLMEKGLHMQAHREVVKTKQTAILYEKHMILIELCSLEAKLKAELFGKTTEEELETLLQESNRHYELQRNTTDFRNETTRRFFAYYRKGVVPRKLGSGKGQLMSEGKAHSYDARISFYHTAFSEAIYHNDWKQALHYAEKEFRLIAEHPHQRDDDPGTFIVVARNLITCLQVNGHLQRALEVCEGMLLKDHKRAAVRELSLLHYYTARTGIQAESGDFALNVSWSSRINKLLEEADLASANMSVNLCAIELYRNLSLSYFAEGQLRPAMRYINQVINYPRNYVPLDVRCHALIFKLIVSFEMNDAASIAHTLRTTYRFLLKKGRLYRFESLVIGFLREKASKIDPAARQPAAFQRLKKQMEEVFNDPLERNALLYFDYLAWLDSRIKGISFARAVTERKDIRTA